MVIGHRLEEWERVGFKWGVLSTVYGGVHYTTCRLHVLLLDKRHNTDVIPPAQLSKSSPIFVVHDHSPTIIDSLC